MDHSSSPGRDAPSSGMANASTTLKRFKAVHHVVKHSIVKEALGWVNLGHAKRLSAWIEKVIDYNTLDGKLQRGTLLVHAVQALQPNPSSEEYLQKICRLGWTLEMLQAFLVVTDDIMDNGKLRRGKPCWHTLPNVGMSALNDALFLDNCVQIIVKNDWSTHSSYQRLLEAFHEARLAAVLGQHLDMATCGQLDLCSESRYLDIVRLKTSHYSFYLPLALAWHITRTSMQPVPPSVKHFSYAVGHYFQAQDDYLDCFGDPMVLGKQGRDIQEGKCTWPLVAALSRIQPDSQHWKILQENLGQNKSAAVQKVKDVYEKCDVRNTYDQFEMEQCSVLQEEARTFPLIEWRSLFLDVLRALFHRIK